MLAWYDRHRRTIPWRAEKGEKSDPYHVWLSEIMCQQTTVPAVIPYFLKFIDKWPRIEDLAAAPREDVMREWAGLGYYARARNLHKCAQMVAHDLGGIFPDNKAGLMALPGIGDYTGAAIATIAFNRPETVVDGNIERVMARQFDITTPIPAAKKEIKLAAAGFFEREHERPGDLAQSLMDLGAAICTPRNPKCGLCPVSDTCAAYDLGVMEARPVKALKKTKPQRHGHIFWITNAADEVLLHTRPDDAMLGGTLALPTTDWPLVGEGLTAPAILKNAKAQDTGLTVKHSFTHFDLSLLIFRGQGASAADEPPHYHWQNRSEIKPAHFPTVFKKAVVLCLSQ